MSECDEISAINKCAIDAVGLLQSIRSLLPSRNGPINSADLIEDAEQSQFLHVAATLLSESEQLKQLVSTWPSLSEEASKAIDLASVSLGDAEFANHIGCTAHELAFDLANNAIRYFQIVDSVRWGLEPVANMQGALLGCDEMGEEHPLFSCIPGGDYVRFIIRLRREAALAWARFGATANGTPSPIPPHPELPIVWSDEQRATVTWKGIEHPVPFNTAEAFRAMINKRGRAVGLGEIVRKPSEWLKGLPPALEAIVAKEDGNQGYRITVFD